MAVTGVLILIPGNKTSKFKTINQGINKCQATAFPSKRTTGKTYNICLINYCRFLKINHFPLIHFPPSLTDNINKKLPEFFKAVEIRYLYRIYQFGNFHFSSCHQPEGKMIFHCMISKRIFRNSLEVCFKLLHRFGNSNLTTFCIPVYKMAKSKVIIDK